MPFYDLSLSEFGGTFLPNTDGNDGDVHASMAYIPEVAEEERRLRQPSRFVAIEEVADPNWCHPLDVNSE